MALCNDYFKKLAPLQLFKSLQITERKYGHHWSDVLSNSVLGNSSDIMGKLIFNMKRLYWCGG
jgi:hypothetical protein